MMVRWTQSAPGGDYPGPHASIIIRRRIKYCAGGPNSFISPNPQVWATGHGWDHHGGGVEGKAIALPGGMKPGVMSPVGLMAAPSKGQIIIPADDPHPRPPPRFPFPVDGRPGASGPDGAPKRTWTRRPPAAAGTGRCFSTFF